MRALFSGELDFMERHKDVFEQDGVRVLSITDGGEDLFGHPIREVTVEATPLKVASIGAQLESDADGQFYGGWLEV